MKNRVTEATLINHYVGVGWTLEEAGEYVSSWNYERYHWHYIGADGMPANRDQATGIVYCDSKWGFPRRARLDSRRKAEPESMRRDFANFKEGKLRISL